MKRLAYSEMATLIETYCAVFSTEAGQKRYILQKMNKQIFKDPVGLMENIGGCHLLAEEENPGKWQGMQSAKP